MQQYGVLVVDDSSFMRKCVSLVIEKDPQFFIIGIARNGQDALEKIQRLKPDLVTMDVEMPEMDGMEALKEIMRRCPLPVVMLSNHTQEGAKTTLKALELGAADFFLKTDLIGENAKPQVVTDFLNCLKAIAHGVKAAVQEEIPLIQSSIDEIKERIELIKQHKVDILLVGCSTGGPSALQSLLPRFPQDIGIPIVVLQHMPPGFTGPLAERFDTICNLRVKEAVNEEVLKPGTIYIAPAGFQTTMSRKPNGQVVLKIQDVSPIHTLYKPSVDVTFLSAAKIYKNRLLAVVMTGMGNDGLLGAEEIKRQKGKVIVESEETCIVYGMPKVIFEAGFADIQVPLHQIFQQVMQNL